MWLREVCQRWLGRPRRRRSAAGRRAARLGVRQLERRLTPSIFTLASFTGANGQSPEAGLLMDSNGNLYGTTVYGGASGYGTVFGLAHGGGTLTTLASFSGPDGAYPSAALIMDSGGNLYGTASGGGAFADGTVFEFAHGSGKITVLASFNGTDGGDPLGSLIMDSGNLYGTTYRGGASDAGTVFELAQGSDTITTLASFNVSNGARPRAGVIMDSSGNLYGTTAQGGATWEDSTVFELAQGSGTITTLASFNGTNGLRPSAGLIMDSRGNLYGTAYRGGAANEGTVFELARGSSTITTLASFFAGVYGKYPRGGLVMDRSGNLYGTTAYGGPLNNGTVFELAPGGGTITALASFSGSDGAGPLAGLIMDSSGNLYGTTAYGGASRDGTVFELPGGAIPPDQWTGANFAVDANWSDGANWSLDAPPTASERALFTNAPNVKSFTATVDAGVTNSIAGLDIDSSWNGTITVNSSLTVTGDFSMGGGKFGGKGAVTIEGDLSQWTGGRIALGAGGFTNTGTLYADTTSRNPVLTGSGTFTNDGTVYEAGTNNITLENGATLDNAAGATFDLSDDGGINQSGGGTFTNSGTLEKTGGSGTSTIATITLDNPGTVTVTSGTLDISAAVTQVSGGTLRGGHWRATGSPTVSATLDITSAGSFTTLGAGATVALTGRQASFTNLIGLATIKQGGHFSLLGGQSFSTPGAQTNNGDVTVGARSILTVAGSFTQSAAAGLTIELGGPVGDPTFGQVVSTGGTVALAGSLTVTSTVVPAVGSSFTILENEANAAINGTFAGLSEGSTFTVTDGGTTMTFQITYLGAGPFGNNNVIITRIF
jgi:uncharacterized repeat protein (TIGR03803 family)